MRAGPFDGARIATSAPAHGATSATTKVLFVDLAGVLLDDAPPARMAGPGAGLRGGAGAALRLLDRFDYRVVILAPCVLDRRRAAHIQPERLADLLFRERISLAGICRCGATGAACADCPPAPTLLLDAARAFGAAMAASWLLAGSARYVEAGRLAGCRTILIANDEAGPPDPPPHGNGAGPGPKSGAGAEAVSEAAGRGDYRSRDIVDAALAIVRMDGG